MATDYTLNITDFYLSIIIYLSYFLIAFLSISQTSTFEMEPTDQWQYPENKFSF